MSGEGVSSFLLSVLYPIVLCPSTGLSCLSPHTPQIAQKVGCPVDDTARMAKCLKMTDPRALTLAYKIPLKGLECEWGLPGGVRGGATLLEERGSPRPEVCSRHQLPGVPRWLHATRLPGPRL